MGLPKIKHTEEEKDTREHDGIPLRHHENGVNTS